HDGIRSATVTGVQTCALPILLNFPGSRVIRGNLLVLPIETSLLYIEPVYLEASNVKKPQLKKVIAATGQNVAMEDTLDKALAAQIGRASCRERGTGTKQDG